MTDTTPDDHLRAALRHAPDGELDAPPALSAAILAAAHSARPEPSQAAAPRAEPAPPPTRWWQRFEQWQRWQLGASGAFATLLMAGVLGLVWQDGLPPAHEATRESALEPARDAPLAARQDRSEAPAAAPAPMDSADTDAPLPISPKFDALREQPAAQAGKMAKALPPESSPSLSRDRAEGLQPRPALQAAPPAIAALPAAAEAAPAVASLSGLPPVSPPVAPPASPRSSAFARNGSAAVAPTAASALGDTAQAKAALGDTAPAKAALGNTAQAKAALGPPSGLETPAPASPIALPPAPWDPVFREGEPPTWQRPGQAPQAVDRLGLEWLQLSLIGPWQPAAAAPEAHVLWLWQWLSGATPVGRLWLVRAPAADGASAVEVFWCDGTDHCQKNLLSAQVAQGLLTRWRHAR